MTANLNYRSDFRGTQNPRHLRAIHALMTRPMPREHLDRAVGCSNSPDLIAELRRRGLDIPCTRIECVDRDGKPVRPGVYHLSNRDRRLLIRWQSSRK